MTHTHTHTHTRFNGQFLGQREQAGTWLSNHSEYGCSKRRRSGWWWQPEDAQRYN